MKQNNLITESQGLTISRHFTQEKVSPFEMFTYEKRSSTIKDQDSSLVFQMDDVEVPTFWSQTATDILAQKYFRKVGVPLHHEHGELLLDENGKVITGSETSIKQVAHRIAGCWRYWGEKYGYFATAKDAQIFYEEMVYMIIGQIAAPNSPQWFTTGLNWAYGFTGPAQGHSYVDPDTGKLEYSKDAYTRNQPHACFVQSISDDLIREGGIFSLLTREARVFKYGSGTGSNFSQLRGRGEKLTGGGTSSGLMSFLKIFDSAAGSIKSGGTSRRAAKMVCLDLDHPEIEEFVWWKVREEEKVAALVAGSKSLKQKLSRIVALAQNKENPLADKEVRRVLQQAAKNNIPINYLVRALDLAKQGQTFPLNEYNTHYESEAYQTVSGQNSNNSVRIPNEFFEALEKKEEWPLKARTSGEIIKKIPAEKLWNDIGYCAWACADPGVQFDTTINEWHTCPEDGKIKGSNPCSEYMFLDDTACNLASINVLKFYDERTNALDVEGYRYALRLWTVALEISVLMAQFPSEQVALKSYQFRSLGLGFANLGALLMVQGLPYDSPGGRALAGALAAIMTGEAYATSAEMAKFLGPFQNYEKNREHMLKVIRNHRRAAYDEEDYERLTIKPQALDQEICPPELLKAAHDAWDRALDLGNKWGYRNAQVTVLAPTGTISLVMDCDTTGVEPDYALVKFKKLAGGGVFKIVNQSGPKALKKLGYSLEQIEEINAYCLGQGTLAGCPTINKEILLAKGLNEKQLAQIEKELPSTMNIRYVFNPYTLGEDFYQQIVKEKSEDFLLTLGFSKRDIAIANEYVCGTMTIEGAPHLKEEHYAIFDCANKCGIKGKRFIHPYGHLKMLSAVQPFISGAISKTINMPTEWNIEQIKKAYYDAWTMMIKAVALYRDNCKLSQPLNTASEGNLELKKIIEEETDDYEVNQVRKKILLGRRELLLDGKLNEKSQLQQIKVEMKSLTPVQEAMLLAVTNMINLGLRNGISPRTIAEQSLNLEGHPLIQELNNFLIELDPSSPSSPTVQPPIARPLEEKSKSPLSKEQEKAKSFSQKCKSCGATQLRQNGTCQLCEICGETTGCS